MGVPIVVPTLANNLVSLQFRIEVVVLSTGERVEMRVASSDLVGSVRPSLTAR